MANTRFSTTTKPKTQSSGTSELPQILKYPQLLPFDGTPNIKDIFCYVIRHYGHTGIAVLIYRQPKNDQVVVLCGDWEGNKIDVVAKDPSELTIAANEFVRNDVLKFYETMRLIKIEQAQFFLALHEGELILVDVQVSINKMASPGMVNDIFGKIYPTQEVLATEIIDERAIEYIAKGRGTYEGNLVLKPSRFRLYESTLKYQPLYVEIVR